MTCTHKDFAARVAVNRVTNERDADVMYYMADVSIKCVHCGEPFRFIGIPGGYSRAGPTVAIDAETAQLPIGPASSTMSPLDHFHKAVPTGGTA